MRKITILIPCHNEELNIPKLYSELIKLPEKTENNYVWEFLFINDGSSDNTLRILDDIRVNDNRVVAIDLSRNFGKEAAMLAGFDYATGDCVVIIDADLQEPPEVIPEMINQWESGVDDVYGRRVNRGKESWLRKNLSLLYYSILKKTSDIDVLPNVGDFRLLDRQCIDALKSLREVNRYTKGMYCYVGFKKSFIDFETAERTAGKSSWSFKKLLRLAIDGITSYTTAPLRFATILGIIVSSFAFVYMLYFLIKTLIVGDAVQGFPTLIVVILFLGGVQLLSLGIIGEYLAKVFTETKRRPAYFIRTINGKRI